MGQYAHLYNTTRWRKRRAAQLACEPLCVYCERMGRVVPATVADHVQPHRGDESIFWHGPLQSLCATCHSAVKQKEEGGNVVGCAADGTPLDDEHHWRWG